FDVACLERLEHSHAKNGAGRAGHADDETAHSEISCAGSVYVQTYSCIPFFERSEGRNRSPHGRSEMRGSFPGYRFAHPGYQLWIIAPCGRANGPSRPYASARSRYLFW